GGICSLWWGGWSGGDRITGEWAAGAAIRDDLNLITLRAGAFDTTDRAATAREMQDSTDEVLPNVDRLRLVQMIGPIKREWLAWLESKAEVISYIPNDAYLVRASGSALAEIESSSSLRPAFVQWVGAYKHSFKIAPELRMDSNEAIEVTVQFARRGLTRNELIAGDGFPYSIIGEPEHVQGYTDVRLTISRRDLEPLAALADVVWIEPWHEPRMFD